MLDVDASMSRKGVSYSTRSGAAFSTPEATSLALYNRIFGEGVQDPNSDKWAPDPNLMLRQSVLSAITEERQALMANVGRSDQVKLDQYFTSLRDMDPGYVPQYLMCGQMLVKAGRVDAGREWLEEGVTQARGKGDSHALSEIQSALSALED